MQGQWRRLVPALARRPATSEQGPQGRMVVRVAASDLFCLVPEQGGVLLQLLVLLDAVLMRPST